MKKIYLLALFCLFVPTNDLFAQNFTQNTRSFVASPAYLGMGGAGVALPKRESAFFYNPAGGREALGKKAMRFTILGLKAGTGINTIDIAAFYKDRIEPAIDQGIETLSDQEQEALYDDALDLFRRNGGIYSESNLYLPAFAIRLGEKAALNMGIFSDGKGLVQVTDGGAGVPQVNLLVQGDLIGIGGASIDVSPEFSVGANAKYTYRQVVVKDKSLDGFTSNEPIYALSAGGLSADVGLLYRPKRIQGLRVGATVYDVVSGDLSDFSSADAKLVQGDEEAAELNRNIAQATLRPSGLSYRLGIGYVRNFSKVLGVSTAIDVEGYQSPMVQQSFGSKLYFGAEVRLLGFLQVRGGFGQGYASFGGGLDLGGMTLDYAYYGIETGRLSGLVPRYSHLIQLVLGTW